MSTDAMKPVSEYIPSRAHPRCKKARERVVLCTRPDFVALDLICAQQLSLTLIVAATNQANAIGRNGQLPWRLSKEMNYFARVTKGEPSGSVNGIDGRTRMNAVIMGRKSWQGIPAKFKPLADRINVVVTRQSDFDLQVSSLVSCAKKSTTRNADSPVSRERATGARVIAPIRTLHTRSNRPSKRSLIVLTAHGRRRA